MFRKWKKIIPVAMSLSVAPGLSSCTDAELAVGLGAIAVGAGAIAIGAGAGHHHHRPGHGHGHGRSVCVGDYRQVCHTYRDYYGYTRTECRSEWDSCAYTRWVSQMSSFAADSVVAETASTEAEPSVTGVNWGMTFEMGFEGSQAFVDALNEAKEGKLQPVLDLGLSREDLLAIAKSEMPSDQGIDALAQSLNQDVGVTRAMVRRLIDIVRDHEAIDARDSKIPGHTG